MAAVLGRNPREGEASGGRRQRSGRGKRWGELGAREGESERSGDGRTSGTVSGEEMAQRQCGRGGRKGGVRAWGATQHGGAVGSGPDRRTAPGSGPSAALVGDMRRARVACGNKGERGI
jgi:hypothetical protein